MNNKYAKILHLFMQYKADKLKEVGCDIEYYTEKDKEAVMLWNPEVCREIYLSLYININNARHVGISECIIGFVNIVCPFCIKYYNPQSCTGCEYAQSHGFCDNGKTELEPDWKKITRYLRDIKKENPFTVRFYKEILRKAITEAENEQTC
jgi:hypothetical protein